MSVAHQQARARHTELHVAAEAVMIVVEKGLLPKNAQTIAKLAAVTGVPVAALRDAHRRIEDRGYDAPRDAFTRHLVPDAPDPEGCDNCKAGRHNACSRRSCDCLAELEARVQAHGVHTLRRGRDADPLPQNQERHDRIRPTPGTKVCPRCKQEKPVAAFYVKDITTGATQSFCKVCSRDYARERYLKVTERAIAVELLEDDGCIGHPCPRCGKPFAAGQRVIGTDLHHETCQIQPDDPAASSSEASTSEDGRLSKGAQ